MTLHEQISRRSCRGVDFCKITFEPLCVRYDGGCREAAAAKSLTLNLHPYTLAPISHALNLRKPEKLAQTVNPKSQIFMKGGSLKSLTPNSNAGRGRRVRRRLRRSRGAAACGRRGGRRFGGTWGKARPRCAFVSHQVFFGRHVQGFRVLTFISHKVFLTSFCTSQLPHKSVNLSSMLVIVKYKLTDLCGG